MFQTNLEETWHQFKHFNSDITYENNYTEERRYSLPAGGTSHHCFIFFVCVEPTFQHCKVKSCYNPLRLGTVIVLVSSGIDFVNTPRLPSDRATR